MKKILLFGAGKSATALIDYLLKNAGVENWQLVLADADGEAAAKKIGHALHGRALALDVNNKEQLGLHISESDIVISLMPPALHFLIAKECLRQKKNLLTASYVDEQMKAMS